MTEINKSKTNESDLIDITDAILGARLKKLDNGNYVIYGNAFTLVIDLFHKVKRLFCRHRYYFVWTHSEGFPLEVSGYFKCEKCNKRKNIGKT